METEAARIGEVATMALITQSQRNGSIYHFAVSISRWNIEYCTC